MASSCASVGAKGICLCGWGSGWVWLVIVLVYGDCERDLHTPCGVGAPCNVCSVGGWCLSRLNIVLSASEPAAGGPFHHVVLEV